VGSTSLIESIGTILFVVAILHTFSAKYFLKLSHSFKADSFMRNLLHLLGEVEVVFGFWAGLFLFIIFAIEGKQSSISYVEKLNFTEPAFVFVIMCLCSTKPILDLAEVLIQTAASALPLSRAKAFYASALILGPLLGSFITEPAAMTVTALLLLPRFFSSELSLKFRYATLGLLFVNISIGGVLTPYAAPPVLMVASKWGWDLSFMLKNFGWESATAIIISTSSMIFFFGKEFSKISFSGGVSKRSPLWLIIFHLLFLVAIVVTSHHPLVFLGFFLFFLGLTNITNQYQSRLQMRESFLVSFFLAGLVVLGASQGWWLEPLLSRLDAFSLYLSATLLTAVADNAALPYLGSQVPYLSDVSKHALVAGAVVGGGLSVIANAPNPAGYGILNPTFGREGIRPLKLFLGALFPTLIAFFCFWFLRNFV